MNIYQTFGHAIDAMRQGHPVTRLSWARDGESTFVFMQVPSQVAAEIIPRMTSLPAAVKKVVIERRLPLRYQDQFALVTPDNNVYGWVPSASDSLATDWCTPDFYVTADETVGTATPM
jgi:hypothetical protein